MKRSIIIVLLSMVITCLVHAEEKIITKDMQQLPSVSRLFIEKYLKNAAVSHIKIEKGWFGVKEYEVIFTDGTEVKFDGDGEWEEVDGHRTPITTEFFPSFIQTYIQENYPGITVMSIEKDCREYEVKLSNHLELKFNHKGKLIDIDR